MSVEAMGWVMRHSPFRGATFLVHLCIADSVNDQNGNEFWMTQARLADKTRLGRQRVNEAVSELIEEGFLELLEERWREGRANRYRLCYPQVDVVYTSTLSPEATGGVSVGDKPCRPGRQPIGRTQEEPKTNKATASEKSTARHFLPGTGWIDEAPRLTPPKEGSVWTDADVEGS